MDIVFCDVIGAAGDIYFIGTFYSDVLEKISFHPSVNYVKTTRLNHISQVEHDRNLIKLFLIRLFSKSFDSRGLCSYDFDNKIPAPPSYPRPFPNTPLPFEQIEELTFEKLALGHFLFRTL